MRTYTEVEPYTYSAERTCPAVPLPWTDFFQKKKTNPAISKNHANSDDSFSDESLPFGHVYEEDV